MSKPRTPHDATKPAPGLSIRWILILLVGGFAAYGPASLISGWIGLSAAVPVFVAVVVGLDRFVE